MPTHEALRKYLRDNRVDYTVTTHPPAYTAQEVAHAVRVSGYELAKVVVFSGSEGYLMAVLPAPYLVDVEKLREITGRPDLRLAEEETFAGVFSDSEKGAEPPFGNLYGVPVWVDSSLALRGEIVFNACTHRETITMSYGDFERLAAPKVASFALRSEPARSGADRAGATPPGRRGAGGPAVL
jgi:Ala-tRNA(Pro) deacylase